MSFKIKRGRILIFMPITGWRILLYLLLSPIITYLSLTCLSWLFESLGLSTILGTLIAFSITLLSLIFSCIHIIIREYFLEVYLPQYAYFEIYFLGVKYRIPIPWYTTSSRCILAVNVGGCLIPLIISITLIVLMLVKYYKIALPLLLFNTLVITFISNKISKVVPGVGVVMPAMVPPFVTAFLIFFEITSMVIPIEIILPLAYSSSTLGVLIGADLLNLDKIIESRPTIASIGGMGTFDGIYLTGIFSIVFTLFVIVIVYHL